MIISSECVGRISEYRQILQPILPGATLSFQAIPGCIGMELLLIDPGFDPRDLSQNQIDWLSDDPPYWIFCWASGRAMAQRILEGSLNVKSKVVADFGSGSGAVAIAAKLAGASRVYACDLDVTCCELAGLNAAYNQVEIIVVRSLQEIREEVDLVVAADVLYERKNLQFLDMMLDVCESVVLADSRLKVMPDKRFNYFDTVFTTSFPDYQEAKENNEVRLYCSDIIPY